MVNPELLLEIEDLVVAFGAFRAVDSLNLYVDKGEVRVIIGPNGAGKTTLLDAICGKTRPTAGRIRFGGKEITKLKEHQIVAAGVGRKFQTPSVYEDLTVYENLEVSYPKGRTVMGSLFFRRTDAVAERIKEIAKEIGLEESLPEMAANLSHGQKQWLEIGMLLIQDPVLLMLDEPVAGMSVRERQETAALLKRISANRSVLVIEHDMDFVREIAHRVTVLHQGKVLAEGKMDKVQADPKVVEAYLGH